jgi:tetratricopeptide (TPR) repeat protein
MRIQKAYIFANEGDVLAAEGELQEALDAYNKSSELYPENVELLFWGAVILCTDDKFDIAKPMFEKIFKVDSDLREMVPRLENHPMFPLSEEMVKKILDITNE